jgi:putative endonuclease
LLVIPAKAGIQFLISLFYLAMKQPCGYILASEKYGTLYIGVTSDIVKRIWEHKHDVVEGFTETHGVHRVVWFERHETMDSAI